MQGWEQSGASRRRQARSLISLSALMPCTRRPAVLRCGRSRGGPGGVRSALPRFIISSAASRVPRWEFLEQVVLALGGAGDREEFLDLWQAAWRAENEVETPRADPANAVPTQGRGGSQHSGLAPRPIQNGNKDWAEATPRQSQRIWSSEIPSRNVHFTGRVSELELMHDNLNSQQTPHVQVIVGMGGIGKTELATEYIHHNRDKYEIIWWIRAEHHDRVRDALVKLAQRLGLREAATDSGRDRTIAAVLDTLQSEARSSWLLVYDNAVNPLELQKYLPASRPGGHIIITSRQLNWPSYICRGRHRAAAVHRERRQSASCGARCPASPPVTAGNSLPRKKMRAERAKPGGWPPNLAICPSPSTMLQRILPRPR